MTICLKNRAELFGNIFAGKMNLNDIGRIGQKIWQQIPQIYSCVNLDEFMFMPNHMHGIIQIRLSSLNANAFYATRERLRILTPNSLPSIINHFKGAVTKECKKFSYNFAWQSRFYDHVIRKDDSLDKIREYIRNNPLKWEMDRNNQENLWM